jgi:putative SOS response-associated peptidase YedK
MCGRYKQTTKAPELAAVFGAVVDAAFVDGTLGAAADRPRYNAAPTNILPIVRIVDTRRTLRPARWGLIPSWARDPTIGSRLVNARSETLAEKPAFRDALRRRRCLVPMDGFYEWKTENGHKQPYLFSFADDHPFAVAGLWETWKGPAGPVESFTILTTEANALARTMHDRMPVLLDENQYDEWLDPARDTVALAALCAPRDHAGFGLRPVSRRLGNVRFDDALLLVPEDTPLGADGAPVVDDATAPPPPPLTTATTTTTTTTTNKARKKPKPPTPTQGTLL